MSDILPLDVAREHLRIGAGVPDGMLTAMIAAAEQHVSDYLGRPLIDADLGWPTVGDLPATIVHAIKLVLTWLYDDRSDLIIESAALRSLVGRHMIVSSA